MVPSYCRVFLINTEGPRITCGFRPPGPDDKDQMNLIRTRKR